MRILFPSSGGLNWMQVFDDLASLPVPPSAGEGSVAVIKDDGGGNFAGMLWDGISWVQAFGPAVVDSVVNNLRKHNFAATVDPTADDDVDLGYEPGSRWVNLTANTHYVCVDNADGLAAWARTDNVGGGGGGTFLVQKSGVILASAFVLVGSNQQATVTFGVAFADANYSIAVAVQNGAADERKYLPAIVSRTNTAFTIVLGSRVKTDLVAVSWVATKVGEST